MAMLEVHACLRSPIKNSVHTRDRRERRDDQKLAPNANTQKKVCGTQALDVNPFPFEKRNEKTKTISVDVIHSPIAARFSRHRWAT